MNHQPQTWQERRITDSLNRATGQLQAGDFARALRTCEQVYELTTPDSYQRVELLNCMGAAHMMLRQYDTAYSTFSAAVGILPQDPYLWFQRGCAARATMRFGQALLDFEQAVAQEAGGPDTPRYAQEATTTRQRVTHYLAQRSAPGFGLEQLVQQEELFQQAVVHMEANAWPAAEAALRQVIALSDGPPQPWSNLGICLMMQERYDEATAAFVRALELDPGYENARRNLEAMPHVRSSSKPTIK